MNQPGMLYVQEIVQRSIQDGYDIDQAIFGFEVELRNTDNIEEKNSLEYKIFLYKLAADYLIID